MLNSFARSRARTVYLRGGADSALDRAGTFSLSGPVNAFTIWPPEAVRITRGAENIGSYQKTENTIRKWCSACGGHLLSEHPLWGVTDVAAAVLPGLPFKAALHVNYASTVLPMRDGLPKQKDFPAEMGGSGELLPE